MENLAAKALFLRQEYVPMLEKLDGNTPRKWGKMNVQQMVEHMCDYVRIANGATKAGIVTTEDMVPKMRDFLMSEKPFRENTPNSLMPDTPPPVRRATLEDAITELRGELTRFFEIYERHPETKLANPFFGMLHYDLQVQLLHKHATHHLRQFGVNC